MSTTFFDALKNRRSYYGISKESTISDAKIQEIVEEAVKYTPTSFNSQTSRAVVLLGEQHDKLWNHTEEILREVVGNEEAFKSTAEKMAGFRSGYGTVLFFEDNNVIAQLQQNFAAYADNFPIWANQSNGMLQLVIWTALEQEGLGASLQHYNPLIDEKVKQEWNIPENWRLIAQMPFGKPTATPGEKEFQPIEERVKVHK
ncbi:MULTISPECIES: nitroreductase family protein [Paenibacillus]|uniref:Oxidoreductase (Fatty acid repression mutant protein) n=1 Tax=Paenibacillus tundrae TaxID=528187 RepID=A0ABT9WA45_9BACL|nr:MULTISPECIES: nitroreductase family protein [Paenibacillus]MCG7376725.1 nitroreductase family protein [Paenibacillus sp. ACRSA]MCM3172655.1 nitroreductase family protein [Paenibacillus sp. MER 99-2]MDQ0170133.1 putative oxidoreductase (fatty acid repression mutant protein) [Paenibacillus tundrae]